MAVLPSFATQIRIFLVTTLLLWTACALFEALKVNKPTSLHSDLSSKPVSSSVFDRRLVKKTTSYKKILKEHNKYWEKVEQRHFNGTVLAYVTPWNRKGYDIAKTFRTKFTHVSPVWYQLKRKAGGAGYELTGAHDVDEAWMGNVRLHGLPKIVPRVMLEGGRVDGIISRPSDQKAVISLILSECKKRGFDGIVLEAWYSWKAADLLNPKGMRQKVLGFLQNLGSALHSTAVSYSDSLPGQNMEFFLVLPPPPDTDYFKPDEFALIEPYVDGFSLVTYDFSSPSRPGPSAPLAWLKHCLTELLPWVRPDYSALENLVDDHVEDHGLFAHDGRELRSIDGHGNSELAPKILLGLNFYGQNFVLPQGGGPILGRQFLELLEKERPKISWSLSTAEHSFEYKDRSGNKHLVFFPSLTSILYRVEEARAWGSGISIWEIGQGLDYFYDVL